MTVVKNRYLELMPLLIYLSIYLSISLYQILQGCFEGPEIRAEIP